MNILTKIKIQLPNDIVRMDKQIKALKSIIPKDTPKDRKMHEAVLRNLREHRKRLLND